MNIETLKQLLHESESNSLDYKKEQYKFINATDNEKSELLKDILAFANSWRRVTAYILIGIEHEENKNISIPGINQSLDDATLQQFVNFKTNKTIKFLYSEIELSTSIVSYSVQGS